MTSLSFFLVPLALGSGFVLGWLLSWMRGSETRRRLRDARIVLLDFTAWLHRPPDPEDAMDSLVFVAHTVDFANDVTRALSGKERK